MSKKFFFAALFIIFFNGFVFAESHSARLLSLYGDSAAALGRGGTGVTARGVDLFYHNPASIAGIERFSLGLQYGTLDGAYYNPDLAIAIPTAYGVLGGAFRMIMIPHGKDARDLSSAYHVLFGGAKMVTPRLAMGMSLNFCYGQSGGDVFYLGAALGASYRFNSTRGRYGFGIFDPSIGGSINFGGPFGSTPADAQFNSLTLGYSFVFFRHYHASITFRNEISFIDLYRSYPVKFGLETEIFKYLIIRLGAIVPQSYDYGDFTCGAGLRLITGDFEGTLNYAFNLYRNNSYVHYAGITMEIGKLDTMAPVTTVSQDQAYISPNHDGTQDFVMFGLDVEDESRIKGWRFQIVDQEGRTIKDYRMSERDIIQGLTFKTFFKRLFQKKVSMVVPEKIMWDGTDNEGSIAADGKYSWSFYTWDERDNIASKKKGLIIVDNNSPKVSLLNDDNLFSPNGDNRKDKLVIIQKVNSEYDDEWQAGFTDSSGTVVKHYAWKGNDIPSYVSWDGKNDNGEDSPEGLYNYFVSTTDRAGNSATAGINEITLTRQYEIADIKVSQELFSFNNDRDLKMFLKLSKSSGLQSWKIEIKDDKDRVVKSIGGEKSLPPYITWDCRDDEGNPFPDGEYRVGFSTVFRSGNTPASYEKRLLIDSTPPETLIKHSPDYFSPDGDGENDVLVITPSARDNFSIASWTIRIYSPSGSIFKMFTGEQAVPDQIMWDGLGDNKDIVESAADYFVELEAVDRAGNVSRSQKDRVLVDILVIVTERGLKMRISNIEFGFGSSRITGRGTAILDRVVVILKKYANYDVVIEGHTDDIGEEAYNLRLSEGRAKSVQQHLIDKGIDDERLQYIGMGETVPLYPNTNDENRRRNRRVEFLLIKKGEQ